MDGNWLRQLARIISCQVYTLLYNGSSACIEACTEA